jgi:hypothetical protein
MFALSRGADLNQTVQGGQQHSAFSLSVRSIYHTMLLVNLQNGTARFEKCKQLFEYQHLLLFRDIGGESYHLNLNIVHFFNTSANYTSVAP